MFVNGAKATEAASILDVKLETLNAKELTDAYRDAAKGAHPDAGGNAERWEKVAWAKEILIRWLEMRRGAATSASRGTCRACAGQGYIQRRQGFSMGPRIRCVLCEGSGNPIQRDREQ